MANSVTNIDQLSESQAGKMVNCNELFDAASNSLTFGRRGFGQSANNTWAMYGGVISVKGTPTRLANCSVTLTSNATNYVEFDPTNTATNSGVSQNTTGFTAGRRRLYTIVVSSAGSISSYTDHRLTDLGGNPRLDLLLSTDANRTLTDVEVNAQILDITSSVSLTVTRDIILPQAYPRWWIVRNGTTGAQSLRFIGTSGTGITVANGASAIIFADGVNIVQAAS